MAFRAWLWPLVGTDAQARRLGEMRGVVLEA